MFSLPLCPLATHSQVAQCIVTKKDCQKYYWVLILAFASLGGQLKSTGNVILYYILRECYAEGYFGTLKQLLKAICCLVSRRQHDSQHLPLCLPFSTIHQLMFLMKTDKIWGRGEEEAMKSLLKIRSAQPSPRDILFLGENLYDEIWNRNMQNNLCLFPVPCQNFSIFVQCFKKRERKHVSQKLNVMH